MLVVRAISMARDQNVRCSNQGTQEKFARHRDCDPRNKGVLPSYRSRSQ
jgi:hypothetical protein